MQAMTLSKATMLVSVVSIWEIIMKHQAGKLHFQPGIDELVHKILYHSPWTILQMTAAHVSTLSALPMLHKDPFDRLLIAQARHEGLSIVTSDSVIRNYEVRSIW